MLLREATKRDAFDLLRVMLEAFKEYEGVLDPPSAAHTETVESMHKRLVAGGALIASIDAEPAGVVFYEPQDTYLYFSRLSVLPAFRNRGVGRALINHVETHAHANGFAGVRLGVRVQLPHMLTMYERLGYRVTKYMTHNGYKQPTFVYMVKDFEI